MQALNVIENPRFEGDKASKIQVVKSDQIAVDALYLKPDQTHGPYRLPERDRAVVVLSGKGELIIGRYPEERIELTPGMVALAPRNTWHAVRADKDSTLVVALTSQFPVRVEEPG